MYLHEHRLHLIASTSEFELFIHCLAMPLQDLAQWRLRGQSTTVPGSLRLSSRALWRQNGEIGPRNATRVVTALQWDSCHC